jgi:hypothetical protein
MLKTFLLSTILIACSGRPNRACLIADSTLKRMHMEGSCESVSLGETADFAKWKFDEGERLCHDLIVPDKNGPLSCTILTPTKTDLAAEAKAAAESEVKAKMEAEAKAKADDAKAKQNMLMDPTK